MSTVACSTAPAPVDRRARSRAFQHAQGLAIGLVTGYMRWLDAIVMRIMDGLMSIPSVCSRLR